MLPTERLEELLYVDMSDEAKYRLVNFLMELALIAESHYIGELTRYCKDNFDSEIPDYLK